MNPKKKKALMVCICGLGITAVGYGMYRDNDPIFIIGLVFIVIAYLIIRKNLKDSLRDKS